jgi:hypothetical protein
MLANSSTIQTQSPRWSLEKMPRRSLRTQLYAHRPNGGCLQRTLTHTDGW